MALPLFTKREGPPRRFATEGPYDHRRNALVLTRLCVQIQRQEKALAQDSSRHLDAPSRRGRFPLFSQRHHSINRRYAALRRDGEACAVGLGDHEERLGESHGQRGLERSLAGYLVLESLHLGSQGIKMRTSI